MFSPQEERTDVNPFSPFVPNDRYFNELSLDTPLVFAEYETNVIDENDLCGQFLDSIDLSECIIQPTEDKRRRTSGQRVLNVKASEDRIDPLLFFTPNNDGDTLLHTAIIHQNNDLTRLIINEAPSYDLLSLKNLLSQTPLHLAVLTKQPHIARALMVAGAIISMRDKRGNTALHIACQDGSTDIVRTLLEPVRYQETMNNNYDIPYQAIPQDFTIANYEGKTCLHLAALNGHLDIVEILETYGVNLNMKDLKTGRTILHSACLAGDIHLVRRLVKSKACVINARAYDGSTPFDLARIKGDEAICMVLAAAGARYGYEDIDSD